MKLHRTQISKYIPPTNISPTYIPSIFKFTALLLALSCACSTSSPNKSNGNSNDSSASKHNDKLKDNPKEAQSQKAEGVQSEVHGPQTSFPPSRIGALSREAALTRSKQITKTSYSLWFGLDPSLSEFSGRTVIQFELKPNAKEAGKDIFVDFEGGLITSMKLNGTPMSNFNDPNRFDGHRINFDINELEPTANRIEIAFRHPYSKTGYGLHSFTDPEDDRVYLYSDFEPYRAHQMFPCFDQPDLKASFELTVEAPPEWQVISNTQEREVANVDGRKSWIFPASPVFSTYVFALIAGPYASWKADADGIPIRLFARKSLAKFVDYQEWLKVTKKGLDFYGTQFGLTYPFSKYDQIIVPDFNAGAMENVGAVTFSEHMVYRTRVTEDRHRRRADTILHEMAHQWFGDLVTMKWWNGLWLNESFATMMAAWAVDQATDFSGSWQSFFTEKQWAYWEDQLVTTHPIELPVPDTDAAESNFDGITYGKGAATLKQLRFYLGEDDFREGIQRYFQKYAYQNTTLDDFTSMLSEASSENLSGWQNTWLQSAGVNTIRAKWSCEVDLKSNQSLITKFDLTQMPANDSNQIRPHRTEIGLFSSNKKPGSRAESPLVFSKSIVLGYSTDSTAVAQAIGQPCPDFVFPNYNDYDYVKVELDPISLKVALNSVGQIMDPLTRQMVWHTLWEMVVDGKVRAQDFADTVLAQAKNEKSTMVLSQLTSNLVSSSSNRNTVVKFLGGELRSRYVGKIEKWLKTNLIGATPGSDQQLVWFHAYLEAAQSTEAVQYLSKLLDNKIKLKGLTMDQEHRWEVIRSLAKTEKPEMQKIIQDALKKDKSDMGQNAAIAAEASIPNEATKAKWLTQITRQEGDLPLAKLREAMSNYQKINQENFTLAEVDTYFTMLPKLALSEDQATEEYSKWFAGSMYPSLCDTRIVEKTTTLLNSYPNLPAPVVKDLKISRQEEQRCIRARVKSFE